MPSRLLTASALPTLRLAGLELRARLRGLPPPLAPAARRLSKRIFTPGAVEISTWQMPGAGSYRVFSSDSGTFDLSARRDTVLCCLRPRAKESAVVEALRGPVCSFFLLDRGFEPLHAGAVVYRGSVLAFVGAPGAGKSSLVAWLSRAACKFLSDDVLPVRLVRGGARAFPGLPQLRLVPGSLRKLGLRRTKSRSAGDKITLPVRPWLSRSSFPLGRIYFLERGEIAPTSPPKVEPLPPRKVFLALAGHTLNAVLRTPVRMERQLRVFGWLTNHVPARRLYYPTGFARLPRVWEAIQQDLSG